MLAQAVPVTLHMRNDLLLRAAGLMEDGWRWNGPAVHSRSTATAGNLLLHHDNV